MPSKREAKTSYETQTCPHEVNSSQSEAQMTVPTAIDHKKTIEKSMTGRVGEYNSISTGGKWQSEQHRWTERDLLSIRWKILIWKKYRKSQKPFVGIHQKKEKRND